LEYGSQKGIPYIYMQGLRGCGQSAHYGNKFDCDRLLGENIGLSYCCGDVPRERNRQLGEDVLTVLHAPGYSESTGTSEDIQLLSFHGCEVGGWRFRYQGDEDLDHPTQ
jgi:hypothetical protein